MGRIAMYEGKNKFFLMTQQPVHIRKQMYEGTERFGMKRYLAVLKVLHIILYINTAGMTPKVVFLTWYISFPPVE